MFVCLCWSVLKKNPAGPAVLTLRMGFPTHPFFITLTIFTLTGTLYAFKLIASDSMTHDHITTAAILNVTADVCRALAEQEGTDFVLAVRKKHKIPYYDSEMERVGKREMETEMERVGKREKV